MLLLKYQSIQQIWIILDPMILEKWFIYSKMPNYSYIYKKNIKNM